MKREIMSKAVKLWLCEVSDLSLLLNKPSKFLGMLFKQILPHSQSEYLGKSFIFGSVGRILSSLCSELILLSLIESKSPPGHSKFTQVSALGCFGDMIQWLLTNPLGKETGAAAECGWRGVCTDNLGSQCWRQAGCNQHQHMHNSSRHTWTQWASLHRHTRTLKIQYQCN